MVNADGAFSWSPDGARIALTSHAELAIATLANGRSLIAKLAVTDPKWSRDGRYVAVAGPDALLVVDSENGEVVLTIDRDTPEPSMGWTYAWAADGKLAVASGGGPVRVWDGQAIRRLETIAFRVWWLEDGRLGVLEARSEKGPGTMKILDPSSDYAVASSIPAGGDLYTYGVSPSGSYAVEVQADEWPDVTLRVVNLLTGNELSTLSAGAFSYPGAPVAFQPGSDVFLVLTNLCKENQGLALADPDGTLTPLVGGLVFTARFSPDGSQVAYTTAKELWVVPVGGGTPRPLAKEVHGPSGLAWSPDGTRIAYAPFFGGFGACD
jgi:WD40 repeat protein